jgi:hypothetical protein
MEKRPKMAKQAQLLSGKPAGQVYWCQGGGWRNKFNSREQVEPIHSGPRFDLELATLAFRVRELPG